MGVIGPNGAGKSTLIKMIMGKEKADSGSLVVGETVRLAVVDQVMHANHIVFDRRDIVVFSVYHSIRFEDI